MYGVRSQTGECRRFPPQITRFQIKKEIVEEYGVPLVTLNYWCGEFQDSEDVEY